MRTLPPAGLCAVLATVALVSTGGVPVPAAQDMEPVCSGCEEIDEDDPEDADDNHALFEREDTCNQCTIELKSEYNHTTNCRWSQGDCTEKSCDLEWTVKYRTRGSCSSTLTYVQTSPQTDPPSDPVQYPPTNGKWKVLRGHDFGERICGFSEIHAGSVSYGGGDPVCAQVEYDAHVGCNACE